MTVMLNSSQVQQNFGQAMDRAVRKEDVIVERYGIPRVAIVEYERYQKLVEAEHLAVQAPGAPSSAASDERLVLDGYRYIGCVPGVCDGRPLIRGTRTPVKAIAGYHRLGLSVDDILMGLPHLTPAQVYEALSYYHDHREGIEQDLRQDALDQLVERQELSIAPDGRLTAAE